MWTASPRRGLTLIEVLVVVAILGILASVGFPLVGRTLEARERANVPAKVAQLVKRAQSLAVSGETKTKLTVDYRGRRASVEVEREGNWVEVEGISLPASLPEVREGLSQVEVVFDERGLLQEVRGELRVNGKVLQVSRWGEVRER